MTTIDDDVSLHHIGYVVTSIEASMPGFITMLGGTWDSEIIHDPLQKVRVSFLKTPSFSQNVQVELIEPAAEDSPVLSFLKKRGGGLHHLCYEVNNLDAHLEHMWQGGAMLVRPAMPAVAFNQRRIAWMMTPQKLLLEFLERDSQSRVSQ